mmetsp:Transcript_16135/g.22975  ORF Transcript_16135/g.22975 Transcript_16135/m.22975 type:complete len:252 (+) Transcript_16135:523-1278(+)
MFVKVLRHLHLDGPTARDNGPRFHATSYDHESIVYAALALGDELFGPTAEDHGGGGPIPAFLENVETLVSHLFLLELAAGSENFGIETAGGGLCGGARGPRNAFHVSILDPSRAEQTAIQEVLRGEITDGEFAQDDVCAAIDAGIQFIVDDLPFGIDYALVFLRILDSNLGVLLLGLEFQFDVEEEDFGIGEFLGHLFESGVGKGFLEGDALDEEGLSDVSTGNLLDGHEGLDLVQSSRGIEALDGLNDHG